MSEPVCQLPDGHMGWLDCPVHSAELRTKMDIAVQERKRANMSASEAATPVLPQLTVRESEALRLLAAGCEGKEVGAAMGVSPETARGYTKKLMLLFDAANRTALVVRAIQLGYVDVTGVTVAPRRRRAE
jgi:DNA-binding NarL/FixJ family response regulator